MIFLLSKGQETRGRLTRGGLTSSRASHVIGLVSIRLSLIGSELEGEAAKKKKKKIGLI